jgi:steroid delta-isomerase-like uncharacterized protein
MTIAIDRPAAIRRMYALLSQGDVDGFGELVAEDFVEHQESPGFERTRDGVLQLFRAYLAAFPDMRMEPEDVLQDGDNVVARVRATGTHRGDFMGMPPSGRAIDVQLIDIMRIGEDGRAHEHWGVFDALGMLRQLGAIPGPGQT